MLVHAEYPPSPFVRGDQAVMSKQVLVTSKNNPPTGILDGHEVDRRNESGPKLCVAFVGMGSQHPAMGRQLADKYPPFLSSIKENDRILMEVYGQPSLLERTGLFIPGAECALNTNGVWPLRDVILSFTYLQISLWDVIQSLGFRADFVLGTSIGEIAMGYASGHFNKMTALGIAVAFATTMSEIEGNGATIFVAVNACQAQLIIDKVLRQEGMSSGLWISSFHSPHAVAIAGTHALVNALLAFLSISEAFSGVFAVRLPQLGCAFHTPLMEPIEKPFKAALEKTNLDHISHVKTCEVRVMSTIDGTWLHRPLDSDYFWDNVLRPTRFGDVVQKLARDEGDNIVLLEIAAHPAMKTCVEQCGVRYVGLIQRPSPDTVTSIDESNEYLQILQAVQDLCDAGFRRSCPPSA